VHILMLISSFPPSIGGAEKQADTLAKALVERGHEVTILTRRVLGTPSHETRNGVTIVRMGPHKKGKIWSSWSALLWLLYAVFTLRRYSIFHAHQPYSSALVATFLSVTTGKPSICKLPGTRDAQRLIQRQGLLTRLIDCFVATNRHDYGLLTETLNPERVKYIPNGIVQSEYKQAPRESGTKPKKHRILFVGRLEPVKNPVLLVCAVKLLSEYRTDFHVDVVGSGTEEEKLRALVEKLDITHCFSFVGRVDPSEVSEYLKHASLLVNTSLVEGISNAILEAMIMRVPVVATRIAGNLDLIVHNQTGLLYDVNDADELAEALNALLSNPQRGAQLAYNAQQFVHKEYNLSRVVDEYTSLYRLLIAGKYKSRKR